MPIHFCVRPELNLLVSAFEGPIHWAEDVYATRGLILADPDFKPTMDVVYDFRLLDTATIHFSEMRDLAEASIMSRTSRRAVLVGSPPQRGVASQLHAICDHQGYDCAIFDSVSEMAEWLRVDAAQAGLSQYLTIPWTPRSRTIVDAWNAYREKGRRE